MVRCDDLIDVVRLSECDRSLYKIFRNHPEFEEIRWCIAMKKWKELGVLAVRREYRQTLSVIRQKQLIPPDGRRTALKRDGTVGTVYSIPWWSLFMKALECCSFDMCQFMMQWIEPNPTQKRKERAFKIACKGGHWPVINWISEKGWVDWNAAFKGACMGNNTKMRALARKQGGYNMLDDFFWACSTGDMPLVRKLSQEPALQPENNNKGSVKLFSERHQRWVAFGQVNFMSGLFHAVNHQQYEVFHFLLPKMDSHHLSMAAFNVVKKDLLLWLKELINDWGVAIEDNPDILIHAAKNHQPSRCLQWLLETYPTLRLKERPLDVFIPQCNLRVLDQYHSN